MSVILLSKCVLKVISYFLVRWIPRVVPSMQGLWHRVRDWRLWHIGERSFLFQWSYWVFDFTKVSWPVKLQWPVSLVFLAEALEWHRISITFLISVLLSSASPCLLLDFPVSTNLHAIYQEILLVLHLKYTHTTTTSFLLMATILPHSPSHHNLYLDDHRSFLTDLPQILLLHIQESQSDPDRCHCIAQDISNSFASHPK